MTQTLHIDAHAGERAIKHESSELARLIRGELEAGRLAQTLDASGDLAERLLEPCLTEPLTEFLDRQGKGFRSRLVEVAYALSAGSEARMPASLPFIVEALHAGSLIIDDIEDDSRVRRGGPALHVQVGLPVALNAGNWLYFLPHRLLEELNAAPQVELELRRAIDRCVLRCHFGQALDLGVRLGSVAQSDVRRVVALSTQLKTGSLLELAADLGAIAGGASPTLRRALAGFARRYGTALQMLDDLSGLCRPERAQKGREDLLNECPTWPWVWLAEELDSVSYARLTHQARAVALGQLAPDSLMVALRQRLGAPPRQDARRELGAAFADLARQVPDGAELDALLEEIERLEAAYG